MSAKKSLNLQTFLYLVILLAVVAVIGFFAFYTNGFSEDYKSFYVMVDGERVLSAKSGLYLEKASPLEVEVKYALASVGEKKSGYSLKVIPNADYDFDFTVNGEVMSFGSVSDYTAGFNIVENENSFTIAPKGNLEDILKAVYPGKTIEYNAFSLAEKKDMFTLEITSYNGKDTVNVNFRVMRGKLDVSITPEVITF